MDALPYFISEKNVALFTKHKIFTATEIQSRYEIMMENYCKTLNIEALTMLEMAKKQILPAVLSYIKDLSDTAAVKKQLSSAMCCDAEEALITKLSALASSFYKKIEALNQAVRAPRTLTT